LSLDFLQTPLEDPLASLRLESPRKWPSNPPSIENSISKQTPNNSRTNAISASNPSKSLEKQNHRQNENILKETSPKHENPNEIEDVTVISKSTVLKV